MNDYLTYLVKAFSNYVYAVYNSEQWWMLPGTVAGVWLLGFVATKFIKPNRTVNREFYILSRIIQIAAGLQLLLLAWFCYNWVQTHLYETDGEKLVHITCIMLCSVVQVICFSILSYGFGRQGKKQNFNLPITRNDDERKSKVAKRIYRNLKWWCVFPALGFLMLLIPSGDRSIVSFLLDNSSSMENDISYGKEVLSNTIHDINDHTDITLSWCTDNNPKDKLHDILSETDYQQLEGYHDFYNSKAEAIGGLDHITLIKSTPLVETMWSAYLFIKEQTANKDYGNRIFILVTDGDERYIKEEMPEFLCAVPDFNEFYQDQINIINLSKQQNQFFNKAQECNYSIYTGSDMENYARSMEEILKGVSKDRYFPVWLSIFYILGVIIILFINPKRN